MDKNKCVIAVPLYKESLTVDEFNSLKQLFNILGEYDIIGYCPNSLNISYYNANFSFKFFYGFWDEYFTDYPKGYNKLMLQAGFYDSFSDYEYMLVYQPDCWVFRDELEYWCNKGYDYIGAPFLFIRNNEYKLNIFSIGNGGFSLRKISFWKKLCEDQHEFCEYIWSMKDTEFGEDHILSALSLYGINTDNFNIPSWVEACKFSFETDPVISYLVNDRKLPFGCHAYNKVEGKAFFEDLNLYKDRKLYSVVTFLFGDYDILRDPDIVDTNAEYICLTDRTDLQSDVWEFVQLEGYDLSKYNNWQKTLIARYTALEYIHSGLCIKVDASVHIKKELMNIYNIVTGTPYMNGIFMIHPWRDNYLQEYDEWIETRNLDPKQKQTFIEYCKNHNYDINAKGIIMSTIMVQMNNEINYDMDHYILNELMNIDNFNVRVDQTYLSIIFANEYMQYYNPRFFCMQALDSDYFEYYYHGKNYTHSGEIIYNTNIVTFGYYNNQKIPCTYLK